MRFVLNWFVSAFAIAIAVYLIPGIVPYGASEPWVSFLLVGLCLGIVNALIKPVVTFVSLPVTLLSLGIFQLVINALMLELASWLSTNMLGSGIVIPTFGAAFSGALVVSVISWALHAVIRDW